MNMTDETIDIPIAAEVMAAADAGESDRVIALIDGSPLDAWFGITPDRFGAILEALPAEATGSNAAVRAMRLLLNGPISIGAVSGDEARDIGDFAAAYFDSRLRGAPGKAIALAGPSAARRGLESAVTLFDQTAGWHTFTAVQGGIGRMLAGDFVAARELFARAARVPPPVSLTVLLRDAHVKAALLESLYGDPDVARRNLDIAASLPVTASWAEHVVRAHAEIAESLLHDDAGAGVERLSRVPAALVGEMWPFLVAAALRLHLAAGTDGEAREAVARLLNVFPVDAGDGYPGSAAALVDTWWALWDGEFGAAEAALSRCDAGLPQTALLRASLLLSRGDVEAAAAELVGMRAATHELRTIEVARLLLLARVLLERGRDADAVGVLTQSLTLSRGRMAVLGLVPDEVQQFARGAVEGWPADARVYGRARAAAPRLTAGERRLLPLMAKRLTVREMAESLFVSDNTIKSQRRSLFRKLDVSTSTDALLAAERWGLL